MSDADAFSSAVWGEVYLLVTRELREQRAELSCATIDSLVDLRITQMAERLVKMLSAPQARNTDGVDKEREAQEIVSGHSQSVPGRNE